MGLAVTKMYSLAAREVKMFNIDKRAEKIISKDKPVPAPKYPSTLKELKQFDEERISKEYLMRKDDQLDKYLKQVYVTSPDMKASLPKNRDFSQRPLPQHRITNDDTSYGYSECEEDTVPEGRISLKQALLLIADHRRDPEEYSNTAISAQYKLPITTTEDVLEHFKMFDIQLKKGETDPATLTVYQKLEHRAKEMDFLNVAKIMKEFPQFKKKPSLIKKLLELNNDKEKIDNQIKEDERKDDPTR